MKNTIKTIFFGTHDFAVEILKGLVEDPAIEVVKVITQPDKPVGRKKVMTPPPVKVYAEKQEIEVEQPKSLKKYEIAADIYDLFIVAQYGKLVPKHILDAPKHGTINVHTSLLPKYRGASPVQSAILHGESETGVTIMLMDEGLDTGPMLLQQTTPISPDETAPELNMRLAHIGKDALLQAIALYLNNTIVPEPQDNTLATHCTQLSRDDGRIDWNKSAQDIYNQYRAFTPWPGVWTTWNNKRVKLLEVLPADETLDPGTVHIHDNRMFVGCDDASIEIKHIQLEGKPAMDIGTFLVGYAESMNNEKFE